MDQKNAIAREAGAFLKREFGFEKQRFIIIQTIGGFDGQTCKNF
jgi:hypothetical protein